MSVKTYNSDGNGILFPRLAWKRKGIGQRAKTMQPQASRVIEEVKEKVAHGKYAFEDVSCFCGAHDDLLLSEIDRYGLYYPVVICKKCGLMRANPRMTKDSYVQFYRHEYRDMYGEGDMQIDELFEQRKEQGEKKYSYFMNSIELPNHAVVFEIGCDFGTMLLPFAERGHEVYGCDYGIEHIEYGRRKAELQNLFIGGPEELVKVDKKADFIILHHVLEHFIDVEQTLRQIRELLKPTGLCYIVVPGIYARVRNKFCGSNNFLLLLQNAHIYQFSLATLTYVVECCGFQRIKGDETIESFFKQVEHCRDKKDYIIDESNRIVRHLQGAESKFLLEQPIIAFLKRLGIKDSLKKQCTQ